MEPLKCPLCCNGTFDTHASLKRHLEANLENLACPSCKVTCNLADLPKHLEEECANNGKMRGAKKQTHEAGKDLFIVDGENLVEVKLEVANEDPINDDKNTENAVPEAGDYAIQDEPGTVYSCEMCDVTFNSVEEHLAQYHEGEEVFLETEEEADGQNQQEYLPDDDMFDEAEALEEIFEEERPDSQTSQIDERNDGLDKSPLITKYFSENGRLEKLVPNEIYKVSDAKKIVEIYSCKSCKLQFPNLTHFEKHQCKEPQEIKKEPRKRTTHRRKVSQIQYQCSFCSSTYLTLPELQKHMKVHLNEDDTGASQPKTITMSLHICPVCETKFPTYKQLKLHSKMHEPIKASEAPLLKDADNYFQCKVCQRTYEKQYEEIHMKSHEDDDQYICIVCNKTLDTRENLVLHSKAHSSAKKFTCSYCKKSFINFSNLEKHITNECLPRNFVCSYCGRRFSRPHEKVKHERIHTGEKPHVCDICGKAFRVKYCLTLHMRTHTGARPYTCHHCGKQFKSHSVCNHHMKTHSEDRNYKCPFCPKSFKTAVQLAGHKNCHTKPFSCTECCRPFSSLYAIKAHMLSHKKENSLRFNCSICGAEYGRSYALKEHLMAFHGYDAENEVRKEQARKEMEESENVEESGEIEDDEPQEPCGTEVVQIFDEDEEGYVVHLPEDTNGLVEDSHMKDVEA